MSSFDISTPSVDLTVRAGETTDITFTVTSFVAEDIEVQAELTGAEGAAWVALGGTFPMTFEARGTRQVTVRVSPPAGVDKGTLDLGLSVYAVRNPNDVGQSPSVRLRVKADKRPFPWWIVAVAAVVLIGVGVGVWFATRPAKVEVLALGAACGAEVAGRCGAELECDRGQCRLGSGKAGCTKGEDCVTGTCTDGVCATPKPLLGEACSPSSGCATADLTCQAGRCRLLSGKSGCSKAEDCVAGICTNQLCVAPLPTLGEACAPSPGCATAELTCAGGKCRLETGKSGCTNADDCVSGGCERGVCVLPGTGEPCLKGQCRDGHQCIGRAGRSICLLANGQDCKKSDECASAFCDRGGGCKAERPQTERRVNVEAVGGSRESTRSQVIIEPGWRYVRHDLKVVRKIGRGEAQATVKRSGARVTAVEVQALARGVLPPAAVAATLTVVMEKDDP